MNLQLFNFLTVQDSNMKMGRYKGTDPTPEHYFTDGKVNAEYML